MPGAQRLRADQKSGDGFQQAFEKTSSVGVAMGGLKRAFGMRHHAQHIALRVDDPGYVSRRAVDLASVAERNPAFIFQPGLRCHCAWT